jgi:predicted RNase H-like HicB family nuclease
MAVATARRAERVFTVRFDREEDGRWIAEIPELSGVIVYGGNQEEAEAKVQALALRVLVDQTEQSHSLTGLVRFAVA